MAGDTKESFMTRVKVALRMVLYRWQYARLKKQIAAINVLDSEATVKLILEKRCSVCRYGDGEMDMIMSLKDGYNDTRKSDFQNYDKKLAFRLKDILKTGTDEAANLLVCIPYVWKMPQLLTAKPRLFVKRSFVNNQAVIFDSINPASVYGDSYFTRFYMDCKDKDKGEYIKFCRKIWDGRDLCIIEGEQSRLGVGNDLFDNAASIERILCPALNAFEKYDKILEAALKIDKLRLVLIALGQTATVLACDMARAGYQAIDIGHIDIEYEWFLMGVTEKVPVKHKYVNEVPEGRQFTDETDAAYLSQIIEVVK